jgi:cation:H+ antiporter
VNLLAGLVLLGIGAEALVRGSARLAAAFGLSPLFIGLTLVAWGTSAPELVVTSVASLQNYPGVAIGNAIGSNIFNTGVVLAVTALIAPLPCQTGLVRREVLAVVATTIVLLLMLIWGGYLSRPEAALFLLTLVLMTGWSYRQARRHRAETLSAAVRRLAAGGKALKSSIFVVLGLALLVVGARWVVDGAVALAELLAVSRTLVGLTLVAAGTSLPELATSIVAAARRQPEIAIGNVLGSNIFNLLGILGIAGLLRPLPVPRAIITIDIPVALIFALACIPIGLTGRRVTRFEGTLLLAGYLGYLAILSTRLTT